MDMRCSLSKEGETPPPMHESLLGGFNNTRRVLAHRHTSSRMVADSANPVRLRGAYLEAVRAEVRQALEAFGYPDNERIIEVYSDLQCSDS